MSYYCIYENKTSMLTRSSYFLIFAAWWQFGKYMYASMGVSRVGGEENAP